MLSQRAELLDGREHVNQFLNAFAEQIELAKNVALIEIKLLHFGLGRKLFFGDAVLLLVGGVIGAQVGTQLGSRPKAEQLRILLAFMVLAVCGKLALDLLLQPAELYSLGAAKGH